MIDASALPYEENIQKTKTIVSLAHPMGVSVEAELGHVGQAADGDGRTDDMYTNVEQARTLSSAPVAMLWRSPSAPLTASIPRALFPSSTSNA